MNTKLSNEKSPVVIKNLSLADVMNDTAIRSRRLSAAIESTEQGEELVLRIPLDPKRITGHSANGPFDMIVLAETGEFSQSVPIELGGLTKVATLKLTTRVRNERASAQLSLTL